MCRMYNRYSKKMFRFDQFVCCVVNYFLTLEEFVIKGMFHTSVCTSVLRLNSFYAYNLISYRMKNHFVFRRRHTAFRLPSL